MPELVTAEICKKLIGEFHPKVIASSEHDFTDEIIAAAKSASVDIYVDRLGKDNPQS